MRVGSEVVVRLEDAHLDITRSPIKVQAEVFDLTILRKEFSDIFLGRFLVDIRYDDNPSFDTAHGDRVPLGAWLKTAVRLLGSVVLCDRRVNFHLVRHIVR